MAAIQLQLHSGKIIDADCHVAEPAVSGVAALADHTGMHNVGDQTWLSGSHGPLVACPPTTIKICARMPRPTGSGTVLSRRLFGAV